MRNLHNQLNMLIDAAQYRKKLCQMTVFHKQNIFQHKYIGYLHQTNTIAFTDFCAIRLTNFTFLDTVITKVTSFVNIIYSPADQTASIASQQKNKYALWRCNMIPLGMPLNKKFTPRQAVVQLGVVCLLPTPIIYREINMHKSANFAYNGVSRAEFGLLGGEKMMTWWYWFGSLSYSAE